MSHLSRSILATLSALTFSGCCSSNNNIVSVNQDVEAEEMSPRRSSSRIGPNGEEDECCRDFDIQTGDPLPRDAGRPVPNGHLQWLATDPRVPFVIVRDRESDAPGCHACLEWPVVGALWNYIDRFGQLVGRARLIGGEGYDATQCFELRFETIEGREGGLLVAGDYSATPSVERTPAPEELRALETMATTLDGLFPLDDPASRPMPALASRTLFFSMASDERESRSTEWAVLGGRTLAILSLEADGRYRVRHLETRFSTEGFGQTSPYMPVAVFDIDADGQLDVVFHESEGVSWSDVLLRYIGGTAWERVTESIHGATI